MSDALLELLQECPRPPQACTIRTQTVNGRFSSDEEHGDLCTSLQRRIRWARDTLHAGAAEPVPYGRQKVAGGNQLEKSIDRTSMMHFFESPSQHHDTFQRSGEYRLSSVVRHPRPPTTASSESRDQPHAMRSELPSTICSPLSRPF